MTNSRLSALADALQACADDPMWADHAEIPKKTCAAAATILRSLSVAEPAAWMYVWPDGSGVIHQKRREPDWGATETPLYTLVTREEKG